MQLAAKWTKKRISMLQGHYIPQQPMWITKQWKAIASGDTVFNQLFHHRQCNKSMWNECNQINSSAKSTNDTGKKSYITSIYSVIIHVIEKLTHDYSISIPIKELNQKYIDE